jgi:heptosyltransferase-3
MHTKIIAYCEFQISELKNYLLLCFYIELTIEQYNNKTQMINNVSKILCIKPRGIGDIVLSTIVIDNLKAHFPSVKIDYLTEHFARSAVEKNPLINKVITIDKREFPIKAALKIRKEKYDVILDLWSNPRSAQITFFSGVKYRVGFA